MQIKSAALKRRQQRIVKLLLRVFLIFTAILWCAAGPAGADAEKPDILYAKSGSNPFSAILAPDGDTELPAQDENLVTISIDAKSVPFEFSTNLQGQIKITGSLPGLSDGKHDAVIETYSPDRQPVDSRQVLLLVDSEPPAIELVAPAGALPRTSTSLLFAVKDNEGGSGVVADPAASDLMVDVTGAEVFSKAFVLKDNNLHLLVTLKFEKRVAPPDYRFNVKVALKDRAGNKGQYAKEFKTSGLVKPEFISLCKENNTSILSTLGFLVFPEDSGLKLRVGESRPLSFYTYGNYGKNYKYPPICVDTVGETAPEFPELSKYWQKEIGRRVEVTGHSADIIVEKQPDNDLTDYRVTFNVSQRSAVSMGDRQSSIQVRVPVAFSLNKAIDYCPYSGWVDIPESAFVYTYETRTIPITLEPANEPFKMKVSQAGGTLVAMVKFNPVDLMDTGASWFEIDGEKHWFNLQDDMCTARGPVREGTVHYKVVAAHKIAVFKDPQANYGSGGSTFYNEGDFPVRMSPPVINGFRYDRTANTLQATIADEGTPPGDLAIQLGLPGYNIDFNFDSITGKLEAVLPFTPLSVSEASLLVTDLAGQTTNGKCTVFGNPGVDNNPGPKGETVSSYPSATLSYSERSSPGLRRVIGSAGNGLHLVEICEKSLQTGIYINGNFVPVSPGSVDLVRLRVKGYGTSSLNQPVPEGSKLDVKVFYNQYDSYRYEPGLHSQASLVIKNNGPDNPPGRKIYYLVGYYEGNRFIPTDNFDIGLGFTTETVKNCRVEERDISSPVIQAVYNPASGEVVGTIHDHGMPLSHLKTVFSGHNDPGDNNRSYQKDLPFVFKNGRFTGRFDPPARGEYFVLEIRATDRAGNVGILAIKVVVPRAPPEVDIQIETERSDLVFSHQSAVINTYMTAEAADDSKIMPDSMTFWLDGQVLSPFNRLNINPYIARSGAFSKSAFNYQGMYAAKIEEGPHLARFRATDSTGLSSETSKHFDFNLAPAIRDFKVMPGAILRAGGPVFTAMVIDRGGDLDVNGLSLAINENQVTADRLFYDSASGYFAVDGPLDLSDGRHMAKLTAIDNRGNRAEADLRFSRMLQTVSTPDPDDVSDIVIDSVSLMELRDHNGDGKANPGELIRLFIPLRNDSAYESIKCHGDLLAEDEKITVETNSILYGDLEAGAVVTPMKGFDLQIGSDILTHTGSDPYEARGTLSVTCGKDQNWSLPLVLPIYRPSVPVDISSVVTVQLDKLPSTTTNSEIQVSGTLTSASAFIEKVIVRVNGVAAGTAVFSRDGGRFEAGAALAIGSNVIEVEAIDGTGAHGYDTGYTHRAAAFVPPAITIATPAQGTFFQCNHITVTGTYDPGSSQLGSITIPHPDPLSDMMCTVTIIDDSNFSADCGVIFNGGTYNINATLETTESVQATVSRGIIVGDCF